MNKLMGAFALALIATACSENESRAPAPPPPRDAAVARAPIIVDAAPDPGFIGVLVAAETVDIAPPFAGVLASVHVRPGDVVTAGAVVAELDPRPVQEDLRAAEAALSAAEASRRQAKVELDDARRRLSVEKASVAAGVSPGTNLEEAELAVQRALASVQRAASTAASERARLDTAKSHLAETKLTARFAGTVALRFRDAGATVAAGSPIVRIVGQRGLRLRFAVPPERAGILAPGVTVLAAIETVDSPLTATIDQVSPALDPASGLVLIEAVLLEVPELAALRPGLAARVHTTPR